MEHLLPLKDGEASQSDEGLWIDEMVDLILSWLLRYAFGEHLKLGTLPGLHGLVKHPILLRLDDGESKVANKGVAPIHELGDGCVGADPDGGVGAGLAPKSQNGDKVPSDKRRVFHRVW